MVSDTSNMLGGETVIHTGSGEYKGVSCCNSFLVLRSFALTIEIDCTAGNGECYDATGRADQASGSSVRFPKQ